MRFSEYIEDILKGGPGSGVKGHRTMKKSFDYVIKEMKGQSQKEIIDGVEEVLSRSPGASKMIEQWLGQSDQGKLENLVGEAFNIETGNVRNPSGKIAAMKMKYGHDAKDVMAVFHIYHASQELLSRKYPDGKVKLFRGQEKKYVKEGKAESFSLSSWSDSKIIAKDFAMNQKNSILISKDMSIKNIMMSPEISGRLAKKIGLRDEEEFLILTEGKLSGIKEV